MARAEFLRGAGVESFLITGAMPPPERQPITEQFCKRGGALLLTHSGTEGRNLRFSHQPVNFDLPWNPMEIEQRIGRLHRLWPAASGAHLQFRPGRHVAGTPLAVAPGKIEFV
jgi:superfamily II DNA/RNA helicase